MQRRPDKDVSDTANILKVIKKEDSQHRERGRTRYEKVAAPWDEASKVALDKAHSAVVAALPMTTFMGIVMTFVRKGEMSSMMNAIGPFVAVGGFVFDVAKFPFCIGYAGVKAAQAGVEQVVSQITESSPQKEFEKIMMGSFLMRFIETAQLLCALRLVSEDEMRRKLQDAEINDLIGLTLLHTAFASRHGYDSILLANGNILKKDDCPEQGRALFDLCIQAKDVIVEALGGRPQRIDDNLHMRESEIVSTWIRFIYAGKPVQQSDLPEAAPRSIELVNSLIEFLNPLTLQAKAIMPVSDEELGRRAMGFNHN